MLMRLFPVALVALLAASGPTAAISAPEPYPIPDGDVEWYCGMIAWRTEPPHEEPSEEKREGMNVTARVDFDACVAPAAEHCENLGVPCCDAPSGLDPCHPSAVVPALRGQQGLSLVVIGVCVTYDTSPGSSDLLVVETYNCWDAPPGGGVVIGIP